MKLRMLKPLILFIVLGLLVVSTGCDRLRGHNAVSDVPSSPAPQTRRGQAAWDPKEACAFMADKLAAGNYKDEGGNIYGCLSAAKNLDATTPSNNIVYRVRGDAQLARQVDLVLNVNNLETAAAAQSTFLEYCEELSMKALEVPLSKTASNAILSGHGGSGSVDKTKIEVLRHDFSNGNGYELHYLITPRL